jgi:hypothetical protein
MSKLITIFGSDTKPLEAGVARAQNAVDGFTKRVSGRLRQAFSAAIIGSFFKNLIDKLDRVDELSQRGFSTDFIQDLGAAAEKARTDIELLLPQILGIWRELNRAGQPSKVLEENLAALGLSVQALKRLSPEEMFRKLVEALGTTTDKGAATAAMMTILKDRSGELGVVLNDLAANGLPSVSKASKEAIQSAAMLKDRWFEFAHFMTAVFAPVLLGVTTVLFFAFNTIHRFVNGFLGGIMVGLELTAKAFVRFASTAKKALTFDFSGAKAELAKLVSDVEFAKATMDALMQQPDDAMQRFVDRLNAKAPSLGAAPGDIQPPAGEPAKTTLPGAIADSLQRIGGGGASFATMQRDRELEQLQAIARASERTAEATEQFQMEMK